MGSEAKYICKIAYTLHRNETRKKCARTYFNYKTHWNRTCSIEEDSVDPLTVYHPAVFAAVAGSNPSLSGTEAIAAAAAYCALDAKKKKTEKQRISVLCLEK